MPKASFPPADRSRRQRAAIIHPWRKGAGGERAVVACLEEAVGLAAAIALQPVITEAIAYDRPVPATLLGSGTVTRLAEAISNAEATLAIVNHTLSPVQQRNLERAWQCKVIDRTGLILEIFGARAQSRAGQLQVELASLRYQRARLVRSWTHLERQRGGFGFLGGPGESQLEMDRRLIDTRIERILRDLAAVRRTRGLQRRARDRHALPLIALVGYTNAGKSTLFNRLTGADVLAENMLFATLDPTMRQWSLPDGQKVVLSDTVGFIADLPTHLIEAFHATLEEVQGADLILHVRDIAHPDSAAQQADVLRVLQQLEIAADDPRLLEVWNKIDLLPAAAARRLRAIAARPPQPGQPVMAVAVAALTGEGTDLLHAACAARLAVDLPVYECRVELADGAALAQVYRQARVLERRDGPRRARLVIQADMVQLARLQEWGERLVLRSLTAPRKTRPSRS